VKPHTPASFICVSAVALENVSNGHAEMVAFAIRTTPRTTGRVGILRRFGSGKRDGETHE
jgi:hypothetical protein